jgi:uncharacterized membrane protein
MMRASSPNFFPLAHPRFLILSFLLALLIALSEIGILRYADEKMGIARRYVFAGLILSLSLVAKNGRHGRSLAAVAIVMAIMYWLARPIRGVGIAVPVFVPPLVAAGTALLRSRQSAPALAYISGRL